MRILVLGNGAWGGALATHFAAVGHDVTVWSRRPSTMREGCLTITGPLPENFDVLIMATPAQTTRAMLKQFHDIIPKQIPCLLTAKGVELDHLKLQSDIVTDVRPDLLPFVLTGPSFAKDVLAGQPTALTLAGVDADLCRDLRNALSGNGIRLYSSDDLIGAQIGGAMKNVVAIGCGAIAGLGLGASAQAAFMTRGFAEMARLGLAMGARLETLSGLSGLGDLTLTCHSPTSRNFSYGFSLGQTGKAPSEGTFEGAKTAQAALALGKKFGVELANTRAIAKVIEDPSSLHDQIDALLNRPLRDEKVRA